MGNLCYYAHSPPLSSYIPLQKEVFPKMQNNALSSLPQQDLCTLMYQDYPDVVNITQLCDMLGGISTKTAYKILQANRIQHFRIGRAYKIPKVQIITYLQSIMNS